MIFSHLTKHLENFQSLQTLIEERKDLENNNKWTRLPIPAFVIFIIASHIFFNLHLHYMTLKDLSLRCLNDVRHRSST